MKKLAVALDADVEVYDTSQMSVGAMQHVKHEFFVGADRIEFLLKDGNGKAMETVVNASYIRSVTILDVGGNE